MRHGRLFQPRYVLLQGFDDGFATRIEDFLLKFNIDGTPLKTKNSLEAATLMFNSLRQLSHEHKNIQRKPVICWPGRVFNQTRVELRCNRFF